MSGPVNNLSADRDEQAAFWCLSLAEGKLSPQDQAEFDRWLDDPLNAAAFQDAAEVWNLTEVAAGSPELIPLRSGALESYRSHNQRRWVRPARLGWQQLAAIAATLIVALLSIILLRDPADVYSTKVGERRVAMLADGSRLTLDGASEVSVRLKDSRREMVLVQGRAKFDVAKDPLRPFTVEAGDKLVVATGTAFSVEALGSEIHVVLYEGHVTVIDKDDDEAIGTSKAKLTVGRSLTPGHELTAGTEEGSPVVVKPVDLDRTLSWETGQLDFRDEPLSSAILRMNRYARVPLALGDEALGQLRISGVFAVGDTEAFVEGVAAVNQLRIIREADRVVLRRG